MALTAADRGLLQRCLNHQPGAWRELVDRYLGLIYHVLRSTAHSRGQALSPEDTEDLAAEVLLQIIAKDYAVLRQFQGTCSLAAYLTVIARRICIHELVRKAADRVSVEKAAAVPANHDAGDEPGLENAEEVQRLLSRLPPRDRQVVRMFYIEGRTYDEISAELDVPRNSIGPILSRARSHLRQDLSSS